MNAFDASVSLWFNHLAVSSVTLTAIVQLICDNPLVQAAVPVTILWFYWFDSTDSTAARRNRGLIFSTLLGSFVAVAVARGIAQVVPFRSRPIVAHIPGYQVIDPQWYGHTHEWNSFPSDHAALFFCLATGILLISRRIGIAMLFYALIIDCAPRVYLGIHFPSDIVAGALIGAITVWIVTRDAIRLPLAALVTRWLELYAGLFYATFFVCTFEVATMFESAVQFAQACAVVYRSGNRHPYLLGIALGVALLAYLPIALRRLRRLSVEPPSPRPLDSTATADWSEAQPSKRP